MAVLWTGVEVCFVVELIDSVEAGAWSSSAPIHCVPASHIKTVSVLRALPHTEAKRRRAAPTGAHHHTALSNQQFLQMVLNSTAF